MPFDPSTAKPKFNPATAQPKVDEADVKRSGYLKDPEQDRKAYEEAQKIYATMPQGGGFQTGGRFQDAAMANLSRVITGASSWMKGDGYQYGKAVDRYLDDMERQTTGAAGQVAEVAGTLATPLPMGKPALIAQSAKAGKAVLPTAKQMTKIGSRLASKSSATSPVVKGAGRVARDAALSAVEQQNLATETDNPRDVMADLLLGGGGSLAGHAAGNIAGRVMGHQVPELVNLGASAAGRALTGPLGYQGFNPEGTPTPEEIKRYYQQQMLLGGQ